MTSLIEMVDALRDELAEAQAKLADKEEDCSHHVHESLYEDAKGEAEQYRVRSTLVEAELGRWKIRCGEAEDKVELLRRSHSEVSALYLDLAEDRSKGGHSER